MVSVDNLIVTAKCSPPVASRNSKGPFLNFLSGLDSIHYSSHSYHLKIFLNHYSNHWYHLKKYFFYHNTTYTTQKNFFFETAYNIKYAVVFDTHWPCLFRRLIQPMIYKRLIPLVVSLKKNSTNTATTYTTWRKNKNHYSKQRYHLKKFFLSGSISGIPLMLCPRKKFKKGPLHHVWLYDYKCACMYCFDHFIS